MFLYDCPHCDKELKGSYGDVVYCSECNITLETDWDLELFDDGDESHWAWLTGKEYPGNWVGINGDLTQPLSEEW